MGEGVQSRMRGNQRIGVLWGLGGTCRRRRILRLRFAMYRMTTGRERWVPAFARTRVGGHPHPIDKLRACEQKPWHPYNGGIVVKLTDRRRGSHG